MKFKEFWIDVFCEAGRPSSKRIIGAIMMLASVGFVGYLTIQFGATEIVKDLINTQVMVGGLLLGISNVTDIWKGAKAPIMKEPEPEPEHETRPEVNSEDDLENK